MLLSKGFVCGHCGLVGKQEPGTAWCKDCASIKTSAYVTWFSKQFEAPPLPPGYLTDLLKLLHIDPKICAAAKKHRHTLWQKPKPLTPPKPRYRTICGAGRRIVLPDEPKE